MMQSREKIKEFEPRNKYELLGKMADPRLNFNFCKKEVLLMISVAKQCTHEDSNKRPHMKEVRILLNLFLETVIFNSDAVDCPSTRVPLHKTYNS
jgi:hypothetical protein